MKKNLLLVAFAATSLLATSCSGSKSSDSTKNTTETQSVSVMDVDKVLASAPSFVDKEIILDGVCTHICKHGGRKIFLMGSDDTKIIRIEGAEVGKFDQKCVNSIVKVKGYIREQRIDEAYLQRWEEQVKASEAEAHGESAAGCSTEKKARGEQGNSVEARIADFRSRIAASREKSGTEYLSFYHVDAISYDIQQ